MANLQIFSVTDWTRVHFCTTVLSATTMHILLNISRSKDNEIWSEYHMRNIFLEESYVKCDVKASPRRFYKKSTSRMSLNQASAML